MDIEANREMKTVTSTTAPAFATAPRLYPSLQPQLTNTEPAAVHISRSQLHPITCEAYRYQYKTYMRNIIFNRDNMLSRGNDV